MPEFIVTAPLFNLWFSGIYENDSDKLKITSLPNNNDLENEHKRLTNRDKTFHTANFEISVNIEEDDAKKAIEKAQDIFLDYGWIISFAQRRDIFCNDYKCYKLVNNRKTFVMGSGYTRLPFMAQYESPLVRMRLKDFINRTLPKFREDKELLTIAIHWFLDSLGRGLYEKKVIGLWNSFEMLANHYSGVAEKTLHNSSGEEIARIKLKDIGHRTLIVELQNRIKEAIENFLSEIDLQSDEKEEMKEKLKNKMSSNFVYEESIINRIRYLLEAFDIEYESTTLNEIYKIRNKIMHDGHSPELANKPSLFFVLRTYLEKIILNFLGIEYNSREFFFNFYNR